MGGGGEVRSELEGMGWRGECNWCWKGRGLVVGMGGCFVVEKGRGEKILNLVPEKLYIATSDYLHLLNIGVGFFV